MFARTDRKGDGLAGWAVDGLGGLGGLLAVLTRQAEPGKLLSLGGALAGLCIHLWSLGYVRQSVCINRHWVCCACVLRLRGRRGRLGLLLWLACQLAACSIGEGSPTSLTPRRDWPRRFQVIAGKRFIWGRLEASAALSSFGKAVGAADWG